MRVSVLVPSYKRPDLLVNCLKALERQTRLPDETVIVLRDTDQDSRAALEEYRRTSSLPISPALVSRPGQLAAMNAGLERVTGDVVCFTDDDAEPLPDWLARIESRFAADARLGALGGRDHVHVEGVPQPTTRVTTVGRLQWFGRTLGNHSQDAAGMREVDSLKGCNMSVRTSLRPRFDERLLGDAYQNEVALCLAIKHRGMKVVFDPEIRVNHFLGARSYGSDRLGLAPERLFNNGHNHILARMPYLGAWKGAFYLIYTFVIGDRATPGLLKSIYLARGNPLASARVLAPSLRGKLAGIAAWLRGRSASASNG